MDTGTMVAGIDSVGHRNHGERTASLAARENVCGLPELTDMKRDPTHESFNDSIIYVSEPI